MAEYDGSVKINTAICTDGFYKGIKKMSASTMQLKNSIKETQNQAFKLTNEIERMEKSDEEPKAVVKLRDKLEQAKQEAVELEKQMQELSEGGNNEMSASTMQLKNSIRQAQDQALKLTGEIERMEKSNEEPKSIIRLKDKLEQAKQEAIELEKQMQELAESTKLNELSAIAQMSVNEMESAAKALERLESRKEKYLNDGVEESSAKWKSLMSRISTQNKIIEASKKQIDYAKANGTYFENSEDISRYAELESKLQAIIAKQNQYNMELQKTEVKESQLKEEKLTKKKASLDKINEKLSVYNRRLEEVRQKENEMQSTQYASLEARLQSLTAKQNQYNAELQETEDREKRLKEDKLAKKRSALEKLNEKLSVYNRRLEEAKTKENGWSTNLKGLKNASAQLGKLTLGSSASGAFSGLGGMINTLTSRLKGLVLSAFVFNVLSKGMRSLQEQTANCLSTNAAYNASLKQIKGNLMTAFYPIYNYVLPAINALMTALEKASGTLAVFSSKLFGGTLAQNQQGAKSLLQQAAAIKSVGKAAGQAKGNLSDIDEMHILTDNSTDASDGASSAIQDYSFGEIQTNDELLDWLDQMKLRFEPLTEAIGRMLDAAKPLAAPFMEGFIDGLTELITSDAAVGIINKIADVLEGMDAEDAYEIGKAFGEFASALAIIAGITGIAVVIAGIASAISSIGFLGPAIAAVAATFAGWKIGTGLYELFTGETVDMTMWEELDEIFGTLFNDSDIFFDALGNMIYDARSEFLSWFGIESPTWSEFKEGVSQGFNKFKDAWGENGILGIAELAADGIAAKLGINADVWAKSKQALSDVVSRYKTAFQNGGIAGIVKQSFQDIQTTITTLLSPVYIGGVFQKLLDFVKTKFTNVGSEMGTAVGQSFASGVNNIFRTIESIINGFISKINGIRLVINKIPGVSLSRIETISLPRLATGTVVPANYGEFQAILGDNKREPEIVSPLSTIEKAVENALGKSGGSNKPVTINLNVILDGKTVYDTVVDYNNREIDRTGTNPLFA